MVEGFVGNGDGVGYTIVAVGARVGGRCVAVGGIAWVRATPVWKMAMGCVLYIRRVGGWGGCYWRASRQG